MVRNLFLALVFLFLTAALSAQTGHSDSSALFKKRKKILAYGVGGAYIASTTVLYTAWYRGYPRSPLHCVNDNDEWLQMDKVGHTFTTYLVGNYGYWAMRWAGYNRKKSVWLGGSWGLIYMTTIEFFDGMSAEWGFSAGDMAANVLGSGLFISQQLLWNEQRIRMKFSYHPTEFPEYRPDLLGSNWLQSILKDYNGQTYWASVNIKSFLPETAKFPAWINVAAGYGASGMIGASSNPVEIDGIRYPGFDRMRRYYLSLDIDWTRIKTRSETVRYLFRLLSFIKLPFPTLEYNPIEGFRFRPVYF